MTETVETNPAFDLLTRLAVTQAVANKSRSKRLQCLLGGRVNRPVERNRSVRQKEPVVSHL